MVLKNKLGITNSLELAKIEEIQSKEKALKMFELNLLDDWETGTFDCLAKIHRYIFEDIYDFAGKIRNVNISKGNFRFVPVTYLEEALKNISKMPQSTFEQVIEKYVEMNIAHPFHEGNGRSMRLWLDDILKKEIGKVIDWSLIGKEDYLLAMERSPIKDLELKWLLKDALTDKVNDREIYMNGVDVSYHYEGYDVFSIKELNNRIMRLWLDEGYNIFSVPDYREF